MVVYWIRHKSHSDMTIDGYIGVTVDFQQRMFAHKSCAKNGDTKPLYNAIKKYGWDELVKEVVVVADEQTCLLIEKKLRPTEHIGWNVAVGGGEISGSHLKGVKQSTEHIEARRKALKGRVSGMKGKKMPRDAIEKTMQFVRGIPKSEEAKKKVSAANSRPLKVNGVVYPSWLEASRATGIPTGSISYLLKGEISSKKWASFKLEAVA